MLQSFFGIPSIYINIIIYSQCMCMSVYVHREKEKMGGVDRSILCTKASHPQVWSFLCVRLHSSTCPFPFSLVQKPVGLQFILISPSWAPLCIFLLESAKLRWSWSPQFSFWRNVAMEGVRLLGLLLIFLLQSTPTWSSPSPYHLHHSLQYRAMLYRTRCTSLVCFGFGFSWKVAVCWVSHDM